MKRLSVISYLFAALVFAAMLIPPFGCNPSSGKSLPEENDPASYQLDKTWPDLPADRKLGNVTGLGIDSAGNIVVFHRAGRKWPLIMPMPTGKISKQTILVIDRHNGKLIKSWGDGLFIMPHGLHVDAKNNIWVTDVGLHQVFKFDYDGKLLLQLGEAGVTGKDETHFNKPTDIAVAKDGSFYVSDGYGNSRIIKFSAEGKYLFEWGKQGNDTGAFNIPHAITLDEAGNVVVADRENHRVQIFDRTGRFIKEIKDEKAGKVYSISVDPISENYVTIDYVNGFIKRSGSDVSLLDNDGKAALRFGRSGSYQGPVCEYHDVVVDRDGNIYVGDILADQLQKFRKAN